MDRALRACDRSLKLRFAGGGPRRSEGSQIWPMAAAARGLRRIFWQRERSVASVRPGRCATIRNSECGGGSSTSFRSAFALDGLRSSAQSRMQIR